MDKNILEKPTFVIENGYLIEYNGNEKEVEIPYGVEMIAENVFEKHTEKIRQKACFFSRGLLLFFNPSAIIKK